MISLWRALASTALLAAVVASEYMTCGDGVGLCGVLTLETGDGPDAYSHVSPGVHGLWPEVDEYGTSECIAPADDTSPTYLFSCYQTPDDDTVDDVDQLSFEVHEWTKHGTCAGVVDAADFFTQVCDLAAAPVSIMTSVKESGGDLDASAAALTSAGYDIFYTDYEDMQVQLSACATTAGVWKLAAVSDFPSVCGGWNTNSTGDDAKVDSCVPNTHGPACSTDGECAAYSDCVRCAHSGFCTDVPL